MRIAGRFPDPLKMAERITGRFLGKGDVTGDCPLSHSWAPSFFICSVGLT